ncbi:MAG TPA: hypothetical protein VL021_00240 [Brumimicrobium sp.]|nr:hypothetical protein [Brumimicrobium sp.]
MDNRKYNERKPRIAKILEVYRINGSFEMAKMAGKDIYEIWILIEND